jgi:acyl-CoA thioester hydrolase
MTRSVAAALPAFEVVAALPSYFDQEVPEKYVDMNGHMNIAHYFELGAWGPWKRLTDLGMPEDYMTTGSSFFTASHHISYLSELRQGERFAVHAAFAERTDKALHSVGFVVDHTHRRVACVMEVVHVHVSMETRRATSIPGWLADPLDAEIRTTPWVADVATGLDLRG